MARLFELIVSSAGEMSTTALMLRIALAVCSMFAMVHLLSLWGTRYGDHNTLSKSLFLSIVIHGCFCLGWATVADTYPPRQFVMEPSEEKEVHVPVNFASPIDEASIIGKNPLPIFQSGPGSRDMPPLRESGQLTRSERENDLPDVDAPQVDKAPETPMIPDLPELSSQPQELPPDLEMSQSKTPKSAATIEVAIDQPALEASPEGAPRASASRTSLTRAPAALDSLPPPDVKAGTASRTTRLVDEGAMLTLPSEIETESLPKPQGTASNDTIRRSGSPNPTTVVDSNVGAGQDLPEGVPGATTAIRQRGSRPLSRPAEGRDDVSSQPSVASAPAVASRRPDDRMLPGRNSFETTDEVPQPAFEKPQGPTMSRAPIRAPETYQARSQGQRMSSVLKNGGSIESERAVENSLKWFVSIQEADGHWSSAKYGGGAADKDPQGQPRLEGGKYADAGATGLVLLSFLGAGYTHERGPYTAQVRKALDWLISQQLPNGYLGGNATRYDQNYCHAIATFALGEAYAMQKDANEFPELQTAVRKGVKMISAMQNEDGGWRYVRGGESDMSMFGWQLMALKSAVNGGIPVPEETRRGMVKFLESRGRGQHGGLAGYKKDDQPTPAMTAESLFCRQIFSVQANDFASQEATMYLRRHLPRINAYDEYFWYYGTLAMHQADEESWHEWNGALRDLLIMLQRKDGPHAGSWDPRGKWAGIGGRLYSTALSTMCLEVYYRYQFNANPAEDE